MTEHLATILALLGGFGATAATIVTAVKKVGEGNYNNLQARVVTVEKHQRRQNVVIGFLTDWQLYGRELIRLMAAKMVSAGIEITPEMKRLQGLLDKELPLEQLLDAEEEPAPTRFGMLRRGRGRPDANEPAV